MQAFLTFSVFQDHRAQVQINIARCEKPSLLLSQSAETRAVLLSEIGFFPKVVGYIICLESSFCLGSKLFRSQSPAYFPLTWLHLIRC